MKILIDTNVILDAVLRREPHNVAAEKVFLLAAEDKVGAYITASSITDIYYLTRKYIKDEGVVRQVLLKLFTLFNVLDVARADCEKALEFNMADYEDALLAACAKRNKMDCIVTRNTKDFVNSPVKALMPDDFLNQLK